MKVYKRATSTINFLIVLSFSLKASSLSQAAVISKVFYIVEFPQFLGLIFSLG
jgi:hypothetical protein